MTTALITGATGYIGSHLLQRLLDEGYTVHALIRSPDAKRIQPGNPNSLHYHPYDGSYASIRQVFAQYPIDILFHLAANTFPGHTAEHIDALIAANITLGSYLLEAAATHNCHYIINTGTYWQHHNSAQVDPVNFYATSKQCFENIIDYYVSIGKISGITLKLFDVYGPNDPRTKLINLMEQARISGKTLNMSPGNQYLDLIHVDDVCQAYLQAANYIKDWQNRQHLRFFVGTQRYFSVREVVALYEKLTQCRLPVEWGGLPYHERQIMQPYCGDLLPGWQAKISLEHGIAALSQPTNPSKENV